MKKNIYIIILLSIIVSSCKKEIDFDYNSVDKLYVVEGRLNNETTEVIITQTQDMEDVIGVEGLNNALVTISSDDGTFETLQYESDGYYRSASGFIGQPGKSYTLSVSINDEVFSSQSVMNKQTQVDSLYFQWIKILNEKLLMCVLRVNDIPDEKNYYCYYMYRNGERYRWSLFDDRGYENDVIEEYITCMLESGENDDEDILYEGDEIMIEIHTIDRRTYDYLYSLALSNGNSSNPIPNFSGGCLGYFTAYSVVRYNTVFSFKDIR